MTYLSTHRSLGAGVLLCAVGLIGSTVVMNAPAGADPNVPNDVWVECSGFTSKFQPPRDFPFPHLLTGCTSRSGTGTGYTDNSSGTETIYFDKPFEGGKSLQLANITNSPADPSTTCPEGYGNPTNVSGTIAPRQPYAGSPVTATICFGPSGFTLADGSLFVIHKVPGSPGDVNPPTTTTPTPTP